MDRGPLALFGAIVAVGFGPALWLGAHVGAVITGPVTPPAATVRVEQPAAGRGGGAPAADDGADPVRARPPAATPDRPTRVKPLSGTTPARPRADRSPAPSASSPAAPRTTSPSPSASTPTPVRTTGPAPDPSPSAEPTGTPDDPGRSGPPPSRPARR